jgi:hypothetical protein
VVVAAVVTGRPVDQYRSTGRRRGGRYRSTGDPVTGDR